ncbi:hypothetical protein ACFL6S_07775 [Candidatus Poribacteria bacterium]
METIVIAMPRSALQIRVKDIANCFIAKGFPYLKVELEANVDPDEYRSKSECFSCDGTGRRVCCECDGEDAILNACATCNGDGFVSTNSEKRPCPDCTDGSIWTRCRDCSEGYTDCNECDGRGCFDDDEWLEGYLGDFWDAFKKRMSDNMDILEHAHIYYDGSVDTEVTLTLWVEYLDKIPGIIETFGETCRDFGKYDTSNAGLHITLLPDSRYPTKEKLDERKLDNFKKQVSKLLLGLTCLGSPDDYTRAFEFRDLEVSSDRKYSAIYTHGDTCIEFRLFDSCLSKPEYIIRYLELIKTTLQYYTDKPRWIQKLKEQISLKKSGEILDKKYRGCYRKLVDVFHTDESIGRLFRELNYLVKQKYKLWLAYAYQSYSMGIITRGELFSGLVSELKI